MRWDHDFVGYAYMALDVAGAAPVFFPRSHFTVRSADRILVAIARRYDIPLVICDEKILAYPHVSAVW